MDTELVRILETHKSFETENARSLKAIIERTDSSILKMFLSGIMLDSTKHAIMLQAVLDLGAGQVIWNVDRDTMTRELEEHRTVEQKMIQSMQDIMVRTEGQNVQPFLREILADERRHHRILSRLLETLQNIEVLKEEWIDLYIRFQQEDFGRT